VLNAKFFLFPRVISNKSGFNLIGTMRRAVFIIVAVLAIPALWIATVGGRLFGLRASLRKSAAADESRSIVVGDLTRGYLLHIPAALAPGKQAPLVLVFHGGGGHDWNMPGFTHFDALADEQNFFVAYPDAINGNWNDGREISQTDDVAFVRTLIAELERTYPVDRRRIYATGISNGGFFSNRLACDLTDKIAAVASVAATMPETLVSVCKPSRPISVLYMHGTEDPLVPINGGKIGLARGRGRGICTSLSDAAGFWQEQDGQSHGDYEVSDLPDIAHDGTLVRRQAWTGGKDKTEVVVYTIKGGGHTWPGGPQYLPKIIVGKASQNLDATRTIWAFFRFQSIP
jgi:polyhydroxybutyrate depolymerase